jgi:LAO/AO transport system kinase
MSKALSRVANASVSEALEQQKSIPKNSIYRIGVTGAPGAGKSTLISHLASKRLQRDRNIGVIAIDPTSPVSHGSLLGDRIRMETVSDNPNIFIRSIPSRRAHDGLADNTADILWSMEDKNFDEVIVETVGVGQAEYSVRSIVDTVVLVLLPESGDAIQAMKAGILEMADIYVVNKSDLPGAEQMAGDIAVMAARKSNVKDEWIPKVIQTSNNNIDSFRVLDEAIESHRIWRLEQVDLDKERRARVLYQVQGLIGRRVEELIEVLTDSDLDKTPKEIYEILIENLSDKPQ